MKNNRTLNQWLCLVAIVLAVLIVLSSCSIRETVNHRGVITSIISCDSINGSVRCRYVVLEGDTLKQLREYYNTQDAYEVDDVVYWSTRDLVK